MKYISILLIFLSVNTYSQEFIHYSEIDNINILRVKDNLVKAKVQQRLTYRQKGDTLGNLKDSYQTIMNINKSGNKIKERKYVILSENYKISVYKKDKIKIITRELDCNDRAVGKKNVSYKSLKFDKDSLNILLSIWRNNAITDTVIIYKTSYKVDWIVEYVVDKKTNCFTVIFIDTKDFSVISRFNYYKDERGNIIRKENIGNGKNIQIDIGYDNNNNEVKRFEYNDNKLYMVVTTEYNDLNLPIVETTRLSGKNSIIKNNYKYFFYEK